ncbi:MAG: response regulator transcription factor [Acidobacteria bacterium]|nr:response regulator transcription factor [Acidobacteriota bacterium]
MALILLIEDEPGLRLTLTDRLIAEGYSVESRADGLAGLESARTAGFDLILLDVMLPGKDGFAICRTLREEGVDTPVLMLTARGQVDDRVAGLKLGADDYVPKPFHTPELLARIEALLRRAKKEPLTENTRFGDITIDAKAAIVRRGDQEVVLSAKEYQLLRYLVQRRGEVVTRETLLREVWGYQATPNTRTVDVHMTWLRQKMENDPSEPVHLVTVRGLGYRFDG